MDKILWVIGILVVVVFVGWLGFQIKPQPFSAYPEQTGEIKTIPLPAGLPAPVERFYKTVYGEQIPVIDSVVIKGRGSMAPFGFFMPARFVFVHKAGQAYRHYFEATWFGLTIMRVNEGYIDNKSFFELPVATYIDDASINQGANLALWAEGGWFPAIWLTDGRPHWQAVDEVTALLYVPFEGKEETLVVRFNPETGLIDHMEAMRFRDAGPQAKKILWITGVQGGSSMPGSKIEGTGTAMWLDQGRPWASFTLEEVKYNVDVSEYLLKKGQ